MAVLEASWRPSWAILEPSWAGNWGIELFWESYGWPAGRAGGPGGVFFGKRTKTKPQVSSTPGTPLASQQGAADLVAFGRSRHRAWFVGHRPLGYLLGYVRMPLKGLLEDSWGSWRHLGASGGLLGAHWGSWEPSSGERLPKASSMSLCWGPFGCFLGRLRGPPGPS